MDEMRGAIAPYNDTEVAEKASAAATSPDLMWDRSEIGKFRRGQSPATLQLVEALVRAFSIPSPVYFAGSRDEAIEMMRVKHLFMQKRIDELERLEQSMLMKANTSSTPPSSPTALITAKIEQELGPEELEELARIKAVNAMTAKARALKNAKTKKARRRPGDHEH